MTLVFLVQLRLTLWRFWGAGVLLAGLLSAAIAAEPPATPQLRIDPGMHTATIRQIATDAAGRYVVTASDDKTARVWSRATGELLLTLRPPGRGWERRQSQRGGDQS